MSNQITTVDTKNIENLAEHFKNSGFFTDANDLSKAVVKIIAGQEMGIGAMAAMNGINIIKGKPSLSAQTCAALIKGSNKYNYKVIESTDTNCVIEFFESFNGDLVSLGQSSFSIEEAKTAGIANGDNWKKYPSDMLFARTITRGFRRFTPDLSNGNGAYTQEELGAMPEVETQSETVEVKESKSSTPADTIKAIHAQINELAKITGKDAAKIKDFLKKEIKAESIKYLAPEQIALANAWLKKATETAKNEEQTIEVEAKTKEKTTA